MELLIKNHDELCSFMPHVMAAAHGEPALYDELTPYLQQAQRWIYGEIVEPGIIEAAAETSPAILSVAAHLSVVEAMRVAVPMLDVTFTPNGIATVGNQTLVPASQQRIDRLIAALEEERDRLADELIGFVVHRDDWRRSSAGKWYCRTLFPRPAMLSAACGGKLPGRDKYAEITARVEFFEQSLQAQFFSPELMERWRMQPVTSPLEVVTLEKVRCAVLMALDENGSRRKLHHHLRLIVDTIRRNPDTFPLWHASEVAELYIPIEFENDKISHGYFF